MQVRERNGDVPVAEEAGDAERERGVADEFVEIIRVAVIVAEPLGVRICQVEHIITMWEFRIRIKRRAMSGQGYEQVQEICDWRFVGVQSDN